MREIKFRAWDTSSNLWLAGWSIGQSGTPSTIGNTVFMQYTGMTDQDGVEIYEGDIVSRQYFSQTFRGYKPNGVRTVNVHWKTGVNHGWNINGNCDIYKVIGNIYENPELLK